jgi:hypothetical protein
MSEEILKSEKLKKKRGRNVILPSMVLSGSDDLGATSGTVSIFANDDVKPGNVTVAKTSSTGYESCAVVGTPTAFASDSSQSGYQWKATFSVTASSVGWPIGAANPVVVLTVYDADGISIGTVSVTLDALATYLVTPDSITITAS